MERINGKKVLMAVKHVQKVNNQWKKELHSCNMTNEQERNKREY
jgi:hypothetical protein